MPLDHVEHVPLLRLAGDPSAMGYEHGRCLREQIKVLVEYYVDRSIETFDVPTPILLSESQKCRPYVPAAYYEELEALAAGCDEPVAKLLALNCLADVDGCYTQLHLQCCNFVLHSPATRDGEFIHGRNLDFPHVGGLLNKQACMIVRTPGGNAIPTLSIGFAGFIGLFTGYSRAGLSAAEVGVPTRDCSMEGMPLPMLLRHALEGGRSIDAFHSILRATPRTSGFNIAVGDGKTRTSAAIEMTHGLCERRNARRGTLVVDDVCLCKRTGHMRLVYPAGAFRYARMVQLISDCYGAITVETALRFLGDTFDGARARRSGRSHNCICNHDTVHSVLFMPAAGRLWVSMDSVPAPAAVYTEVTDDQIWQPELRCQIPSFTMDDSPI